jgi:hypothetical protein
LYKDLLLEDQENLIWMPSSVNIPTQGMVFANGPSSLDWNWAAVKAVPVLEEEKKNIQFQEKRDNIMNGEWI